MCPLLGVARSTLYGWRHRAVSPTAAQRRVLAEHVRRVVGDITYLRTR
jgi:hypothetical protein